MKKRLIAAGALMLLLTLLLSAAALAAGTIKLTLVQKTDTTGWSDKKVCNHYYYIYQGEQEIISKTFFPNNETTVIELPKIKEQYTIRFGTDGVYSTGEDNPFEMLEGIEKTFPGNKSLKLTFDCSWRGAAHGLADLNGFSLGSGLLTTDADSEAGETGVSVPGAIVLGVASAVGAAVGAGAAVSGAAAGGGGEGESEEEGGSTYRMYVYKEFGNKIKYHAPPVFVYARMAEVTETGEERERPDLTGQIEIRSGGVLTVGEAVLSGSYLGASVRAEGNPDSVLPTEGTVSFRFTGAGGTFQNNVVFQLVGECLIELPGPNLYLLGASGRRFELPYTLRDFLNKAEVTVSCMQTSCPFTLETGKDKDGNPVIAAVDNGEKKPLERFFDSYSCEIVAQNEAEYARTVFSAVVCYEGLLPDFLGKPHEIRGYQTDSGEMEETLIAFRLGVWSESEGTLAFVPPGDLTVDCDDEAEVFEVIGLDYERDTEQVAADSVLYRFRAKLSLPSDKPVKGTLTATCQHNGADYDSQTEILLIPDVQAYYESLEEEYEKCKYIISTYMAESWRSRKLAQLEKARPAFGIKDYRKFRKDCWLFAQNLILQEKESYLQQSYSADIAIAHLEIYVYIGNVAFDIALMPVGGPLAGFLIAQAKDATLELIAMRVEKGGIGFPELNKLLMKRIEQASGQADGAVAMPKPSEPGKLAVWLSCFFLYRFLWNWYWTTDENNQPIGITGALEKAVYEFAGKAVTGLLGNFVDAVAENSSFVKAAGQVYNKEKDEALAKPVTDLGERAFQDLIELLEGYLNQLRRGLA